MNRLQLRHRLLSGCSSPFVCSVVSQPVRFKLSAKYPTAHPREGQSQPKPPRTPKAVKDPPTDPLTETVSGEADALDSMAARWKSVYDKHIKRHLEINVQPLQFGQMATPTLPKPIEALRAKLKSSVHSLIDKIDTEKPTETLEGEKGVRLLGGKTKSEDEGKNKEDANKKL